MTIDKDTIKFCIDARQYLHINAEVSGKEQNTSYYITENLRKFGFDCFFSKGNNVIAVLDTKIPGKTLMLRADIDALPLQEDEYNLKEKRHIISKNHNAAHMCGHDFHTAIMLTVAKVIKEGCYTNSGKIIFCFEAAEEIGGGVFDVIDTLKKNNLIPDACFAIHIFAGLHIGKVALQAGPIMAGSAKFEVTVNGRGGHGSRPDQTIDPISCSAQIINSLHTISSRVIDPNEALTMSVCTIHSGIASNIIPDSCTFSGTIRFFNNEQEEKARNSFYRIVENIALANQCTAEIIYKGPHLPVINDLNLSKIAIEASINAIGKDSFIRINPWMASDSMSRYSAIFPCLYALLGIEDIDNGYGAAHHNVKFDAPEICLEYGVNLTLGFVKQFFGV